MDRYSKVILTIIMFLLIAILLKPKLISEVAANPGITDVNVIGTIQADVNIAKVGGQRINMGPYVSPYNSGVPVYIIEK
ncbi:MAG: hypothetical protein JXQ30_12890 [Spirochaetes bacterium]|nr:hypothetical protein [Spirochaetota bacterium]